MLNNKKEGEEMTVADRIRIRREQLGLSQEELANRMGLKDKSSITKIEKSGNKITLKNVERLAYALHTSVPYLMGWEEETDNQNKLDIQADREARFLELYSRLNDYEKSLIDNMLTTLTSKK